MRDSTMEAIAVAVAFIGVHIITAALTLNMPAEPENVKFTGQNGVVCYAHMKTYNDNKPYIAHSHCESESKVARNQ